MLVNVSDMFRYVRMLYPTGFGTQPCLSTAVSGKATPLYMTRRLASITSDNMLKFIYSPVTGSIWPGVWGRLAVGTGWMSVVVL